MTDVTALEDWTLSTLPRKRRFEVPDPPQKPDFIHGADNIHWSQFSRRLAATPRKNGKGFDVKLYDPRDRSHVYKNDPNITPWYRLGPPSNMPDYPPLLEKYGMQVLEAAGFLNHKEEKPAGEPAGDKINGRLAFQPWRNHTKNPNLQSRIHPVLRRNKWIGIDDHQYSLMVPSLLLASAILDDPVTLTYFYALSMPSAEMDTIKHVSAGLTADCKIMKIPYNLTEAQLVETYHKLFLMTAWLENWSFYDDGNPVYGYTERIKDKWNHYEPIRIKPTFMKILEYDWKSSMGPDEKEYYELLDDILKMAGIPLSQRAHINSTSAIYRTQWFLAKLMLHEFTHAFCMAYFELPLDWTPGIPTEPWAPSDRCNEQGWAFENFVLGGVLKPMTVGIPPMHIQLHDLQGALVPFGFYTTQFWDRWLGNRKGSHYSTMDSDRKEGDEVRQREYPIPQAWTQWLFSGDLWADQVIRFGLRVIKVPKPKEWEIPAYKYGRLGRYCTGEDRWNIAPNTENKTWLPNWDEWYLEGVPKEEWVWKQPKWEP
ncbi:hypothetical protein E4T50_06100 [Aureobasidium sp. EXF-12298]|nr:hypothetical protein E4T50_06100 [Aureobasidium sp. EXF-12298]